MAPDRSTLYARAYKQLLAIDPDTLTIQQSYALPDGWQDAPAQSLPGTITHDLRLWFVQQVNTVEGNSSTQTNFLATFDLRSKRFERIQSAPALSSDLLIGSSGDGSRLVALRASAGSGNFLYDTATSQFTPFTQAGAADTVGKLSQVSGDGKAFLVDGQLLFRLRDTGDAVLSGRMPGSSALSANGTRIYALSHSNSASTVIDRVTVFDASAPGQANPTGEASLPVLGTIDLPTLPEPIRLCSAFEIALTGCEHGELLASPLGDALVWPAFRRFVVITVPQNLQP
jgi:hypothetical protein